MNDDHADDDTDARTSARGRPRPRVLARDLMTPYVWCVLKDEAETTIVGALIEADYDRFGVACIRLDGARIGVTHPVNGTLDWKIPDGPVVIAHGEWKYLIEAPPPF